MTVAFLKLCKSCRYYVPINKNGQGQCRRYPPQPVVFDGNSIIPVWPMMAEDDGCGEHESITRTFDVVREAS